VITVRSIYYQGLFLTIKPTRVANLKDFHLRTGKDKTKRKTQERMKKRSRKRSSSAGSEKKEIISDRKEKNGEVIFDRPKPTAGCSANGRRRRCTNFSNLCLE
jgi:hypothetical protein